MSLGCMNLKTTLRFGYSITNDSRGTSKTKVWGDGWMVIDAVGLGAKNGLFNYSFIDILNVKAELIHQRVNDL